MASEIDAQSEVGEVYMRSLMRSQLRLALGTLLLLAATVGTLPLMFEVFPAVRCAHLFGVPLPWLLLGLMVYPVLLLFAWSYVRRAERNEESFLELVRPRVGEEP